MEMIEKLFEALILAMDEEIERMEDRLFYAGYDIADEETEDKLNKIKEGLEAIRGKVILVASEYQEAMKGEG